MDYNIYVLKSPINGDVVYVGITKYSIEHRLKQHYWHLNEVFKGTRKTNKRFEYLKSILPLKVSIKLVKTINTDKQFSLSKDFYERYYIKKYRKLYPNLLNETDGGEGQNTHLYKNEDEIKTINEKISIALKGRPKPKGFAEHLSEIRKGSKNPMAKEFEKPIYIIDYRTNKRLKGCFIYGFQINEFIGVNDAWSNVKRVINKLNRGNGIKRKFQSAYGYYWLTWEYAKNYSIE